MESTLAINLTEIEARLGRYLGYGTDKDTWDAEQTAEVSQYVKTGLRKFYFRKFAGGIVYDWSFLRPVATLTLASGDNTIDLPADFGEFEGRITVSSTTNSFFTPMELRNPGWIREQFAKYPNQTGKPKFVAREAKKGTTVNSGQRFRLYVFPTADQAYTIQGQYYLLPDVITEQYPYTYGGAQHSETVAQACLSAAELESDNQAGVHTQLFEEHMMASIAYDRKGKEHHLGYNADHSDSPNYDDTVRHFEEHGITIDGSLYQ